MIYKNRKKSFLSTVLSVALLIASVNTFSQARVYAVGQEGAGTSDSSEAQADSAIKYNAYADKSNELARPMTPITVRCADNYSASAEADVKTGECSGRSNVLIWSSDNGEISWKFSVENAGSYFMRLTYFSLNADAQNIELNVKIDGKTPFFEAGQLIFPKCFHSETEITQDGNGNDIRPKQVSYDAWITASAQDDTGVTDTPYSFNLSKGEHTLTLVGSLASVAVDTVEFYNKEASLSYAEYSKGAEIYGDSYTATYEAEEPLYTSSKTLYPVYDRTSTDTSPSHPVKLRYNTIGQSNYSSHGQYIVWTVEAPADGYYYLGARIRQNINTGTNSYRRLYVNGEVPFSEADSVKFGFNNKWQDYVFGGDEPWLIHLNKGENQIKLEVVSGEMTEVLSELQDLVNDVNGLYREIVVITGASPDGYRDYHIDKEITGFNEKVSSMSEKAQRIFDKAVSLGNSKAGTFAAITKLKLLLDTFIKSPSQVPSNISTLNSYASGISSLMLTIQSQPLELDTITVSSDYEGLFTKTTGFFGNIKFQILAFIGSFTEDYFSVSGNGVKTQKNIEVWMNTGREQANVLKSLSDSQFTVETQIGVNFSLVSQGLVQASLSGMSPDLFMFIDQGSPVNLAMRGGLAPLSGFDTFDNVVSRFAEHSMDSYYYNGDYYGIPVTVTFPMMFYRVDIFEKLNLNPPDTWDDMYKIIKVLQQNNLTVGIPNADSSSVMSVDTGIYAMFMYQNGETFYSEDFSSTNFDSEVGISAFGIWTELYKDYGLPNQYNFLNRFRSGDMPIGLSSYSFYGQLKQTAPEIEGLWKMLPVPGTKDENGNINRSVCATTTCIVMMRDSQNKEEAWQFIDWATDVEAQSEYGREIEAVLGASSRFTPANVQALGKLSWNYEEQSLLSSQWKEIFTLPQIPGSYIVDRNLISAFRKVVYSSANPRETIISYNNTIENEITRKRKEFNLD